MNYNIFPVKVNTTQCTSCRYCSPFYKLRWIIRLHKLSLSSLLWLLFNIVLITLEKEKNRESENPRWLEVMPKYCCFKLIWTLKCCCIGRDLSVSMRDDKIIIVSCFFFKNGMIICAFNCV